MSYSDLYLKSRSKYPLVLLPVALMALVGFFSFFFNTSALPTRASKTILKRHQLVNVAPTEVGIFWQTDSKNTGWIIYGDSEKKLTKTALDERDLETKRISSLYHYALVRNLEPKKTYYYKIITDTGVISNGTQNHPFTLKTGSAHSLTNSVQPVYGKMSLSNGSPAGDIFVVLQYKNAYPLLTLTKVTTGELLLPLNYLYDKKTLSPLSVTDKDLISLELLGEGTASTHINAVISRAHPFPQTLILGKNYTFASEDKVLSASVSVTPTLALSATPAIQPVTITSPKENAVIPGTKPLIRGTAPGGGMVTLTLLADRKQTYSAQVDDNGMWKIGITSSLAAGKQTAIISVKDTKGRVSELRRSFTIAKSGEQVLAEATGPATLTPSPTIFPTQILTQVPTTIITSVLTPTPSNLLPTGNGDWTFFVTSAAFVIAGIGLMLVF